VSDRRTVIADAVIATLAQRGSRGLTHRAVDEAAGLPAGSTSYYLRTRSSLLDAAVRRMAELDAAALPDLSGTDISAALAGTLAQILRAAPERLLARYELTLEAARRPELREALVAGSRQVRGVLSRRLAEQGLPDADERADAFLAVADGLLLSEVTGTHGRPRTTAELRRAIASVVDPPADLPLGR
jgi:DNA-binding transcriptional regulator YbjK